MPRPTHLALAAASCLLALTLAGCGGGGDSDAAARPDLAKARAEAAQAPKDAARSDYCTQWKKVDGAVGAETDDAHAFARFQDALRRLEKVGTPPGVPTAARHGFEVSVGAVLAVTWDQAAAAGKSPIPGVTEADRDDASTFVRWSEKTCGTR